jgi:hypothetical protein
VYTEPVRFKNFSGDSILIPQRQWVFPAAPENLITVNLRLEPGELTVELDPADPLVQVLLKAHPELRPVVLATAWQRVLDGVL